MKDEFYKRKNSTKDLGEPAGQVIELKPRARTSSQGEISDSVIRLENHRLDDRVPAVTYYASADDFLNILYVSPQVESILGYSQEEYLADSAMWRKRIHPEDRKLLYGEITRCYAADEPLVLEYRLISKEGRVVWLRDEAVVVRDSLGKPLMLQGVILDITQYKQAERALRENESYFHSLLASMHEDMLLIDKTYRISDTNKEFLRVTGYRREEIIGRYCYEVLRGYDKPCIHSGEECKLVEVFETGRAAGSCHQHVRRDGTRILVDLLFSPLRDEKGKITHIIKTVRDATGGIEAVESLRTSEESLRSTFDHVPAMAFLIDRDGRLLPHNSEFASKLGCRAGLNTLDPEALRDTRQFWHGVARQVLDSGEPTSYMHLIDCANEGPVYLAERMWPVFGKDGEVSMAIALVSNITGEVNRETTVPAEKPLLVNLAHANDLVIIGESKAIKDVFRRIEAIAATETTVLVTGESGAGKELAAEAIHNLSKRTGGPLIKVNCAALPESIIESELFGHVKGAFTSAVQTRIGRFEAANKGTIFLDEIGEISPAVQLRLLRVLDERTVEKVGDYKPIKVDVRIIAATNQDLRELVDKGKFRKDLYYRLRVFNVHVPPLRERPDDIPLLAAHFLGEFSKALGKRIHTISNEGMKLLLSHKWPGNVRELMNVIESACALCGGETVRSEDLMQVFEPKASHFIGTRPRTEMEIREALRLTRGNKVKAAKLLGIARRTLYRRMKRYGIGTDVS